MEGLKRIRKMVHNQLNLAESEINKNREIYGKLRNKKRDILDDITLSNALREITANERLKISAEILLEAIEVEIESMEYEETEDYKRFQMALDEVGRDIPIDIQI